MDEFVSPKPQPVLASQTTVSDTVTPDPEPDVAPDGESALCLSCLFPNLPEAPRCKRCGAPMGSLIDYFDALQTVGYAYRGATNGSPKLLVVFVIWMQFFPPLLLSIIVLFKLLTEHSEGELALFLFGWAIVCGIVSITMLYRTTKNHCAAWKRANELAANADSECEIT